MPTEKITTIAQYLTFKLGDEIFAINVFKTREVLEVTTITKVPNAPEYMLGVVNVRGNAIPVVDLRTKFGLPKADNLPQARIIVMEIALEENITVVGGLADSVHEVIEIEPQDIEPPPSIGMKWNTELILGMGKYENNFIIILDIDKVFANDDLTLAINANLQPEE